MRFCYLFLATLFGSALFADALPRPTGVVFDKGALFTVAGYTGSSPLSDFPVLVRIAANSPFGFLYTDLHSQSDGDDIAFVDMEGNVLPFEIDTWDPSGTSLIWVRLPTMEQGAQFVMCWGSGTSGKEICPISPFAGYVGVWHMSEANGAIADSSGHGRDAVPAGTNAESLSIAGDGPVGNGRQCAANAYLSVANAAAMNVGNTFAVSGWFFQSTNQTSDARLFSRKIRNQQTNNGWEVICKYLKTNPPYSQISARGADAGNKADCNMHGVWSAYGWQHLTIVYNGTKASIYLDGEECIVDASDINEATDNDNSLAIGSYSGGESSYFIGSVDECRILDAVPTADWVAADCATVTNAAFLSAGKAVYFDGATTPVPAIELVGVEYNAENYTADVDYSVVWTGYGCQDVDVLIAWGYAPTDLVHTNAVATCTAGPGHCAVPLFKDEVTIYIKAIVTNELGYVGISADVAELYVEKNDKAQEEKVPILSDVGISRVDGVYAVITGVVASVGNYTGDVPQCAIRLWYGEDPASPSSVVESVVGLGPFALNAMNLQVGVQYGCRVEMEDAAGEHVESAAMTFTTKGSFELGEVVSSAIDRTITVSSSNGVAGASTTSVFAKWDGGDWALVKTFDVDSPSLEFEATYTAPGWGAVSWQIMVSNECMTVDGEPTGIFWTNVVAGTQMPIDGRTYYWQPVDGDWNGNWNDPAHWSHNGGDGGRGYPDNASSTASFENCRAANPVVVNVNGNYTIKLLVPYGKSAASSVRFKGNGRDVSGITSASFPSYTDGVTPAYPIAANTTMEFFDMTVVRGGPWEVIRSGGGTSHNHSDITNVTMRLSGTTMRLADKPMSAVDTYFAFATPYSRLELLNYSTNIFSKSCFGGTNAVVVVDNSCMRASGSAGMGILLPQDVYGEGLFVLRGQDAVVESAGGFGTHNNGANAKIVLDIPVGGFRNPPIVLTGSYKFAAPSGSSAMKLSFEVSEKSPALRKSHAHLSNMVIVQTESGIDTSYMDDAIGTVPVHSGVSCGEFKYGAGGAPLADGASLSTARQILLDLNGYGGAPLFIRLR